MENNWYTLAREIRDARKITVLTGAGISTESGIPDFRSSGGLWSNNRSFVDIVSKDYYEEDPAAFWHAFKDIFQIKLAGQYLPNKGHHFFADLENMGKEVSIITQNIDGLHELAGSTNVFEIHGNIRQAYCPTCQQGYDLSYINESDVPTCSTMTRKVSCQTVLKPNVVLYGDKVHDIDQAFEAALTSDLLIIAGTSLEVTPVNYIPLEAVKMGTKTAIINKEKTRFDPYLDVVIHSGIGDAVDTLQRLVQA